MTVVSDVRKMSMAAAIGVLLTAARSILLLRFVGPDTIGVWKSVMMLYVFAEILRFGVQRGLSARLPLLLGEGKTDEADRITRSVTSFAFYSGLLMVAVCLLLSLLNRGSQYGMGFLLMAGVLFSAQFHILIREVTVARHRFGNRALETLFSSTIDFAAILGLGSWFGLVGIGIGTIACIAIPALYLFAANRQAISLRPAWPDWISLAREGFRFSIMDALYSCLRFSDVAALAFLGGSHVVGLYTLSQLSHDFSMFIILAAVGQVVTPHLMRVYGETGSLARAAEVMDGPLRWISLLLPPILGLGTLVGPPIVEWLLPAYAPGLDALQYSLWSVFFLALHAAQVAFFQASGQFPRLFRIFAWIAPAGLLAQWISWNHAGGLDGAALTGAATLFVAAAAEYLSIRRILGESHFESILRFSRLCLPFAVSFAACQLLPNPAITLVVLCITPCVAFWWRPLRLQLEQSQ
ncbi:lipopolysaccharide biosynthesis protein [Bryobacter aggregatus]|uniref:lipopolysaccharide biosynthesis protein n=1 Tax=Bryobacter aggregatus TaxID=360054 RepID=UPI0004E26515|nr:hypothetical protein [Bryobacter aggregatus]